MFIVDFSIVLVTKVRGVLIYGPYPGPEKGPRALALCFVLTRRILRQNRKETV